MTYVYAVSAGELNASVWETEQASGGYPPEIVYKDLRAAKDFIRDKYRVRVKMIRAGKRARYFAPLGNDVDGVWIDRVLYVHREA